MPAVVVAWCGRDDASFEANVPLAWSGRRNARLGSRNDIHVLFLDGYERLSDRYLDGLRDLGYDVRDCGDEYRSWSRRFPMLDRFGDYEKKCFLRWLVIAETFAGEPVLHFDGDVVFNATPETIAEKLGGFTFVLQGCPALMSTAGSDWLDRYRIALDEFTGDIEGYSACAWREREGWEASHRQRWSGVRSREIISSDQDLISHLIHTCGLPQDDPTEIRAGSDLVLFENPLYWFSHNAELMPAAYARRGGIDHLNDRPVAMWHMQANFVQYLSLFLSRGRLNGVSRCGNPVEEQSWDRHLWRLDRKLRKQRHSRLGVYEHFFDRSDFSEVLSSRVFWKPDAFAPSAAPQAS